MCRSAAIAVLLVIAALLLLQARKDDILFSYHQAPKVIAEDLMGVYEAGQSAPAYAKELSLHDLKHMLASISQDLRVSAIQVIAERGEYEFIPYLTKLLNETDPIEGYREREQTSFSKLSRDALERIARERIKREPANLSLLQPYLGTATNGTFLERKAMIEILGNLGEPLGVPLLRDIAMNDGNFGLRQEAERALTRITSYVPDNKAYREIRATQLQVFLVMSGVTLALVWFMVNGLRKSIDIRFVLFAMVPILICSALAYLTIMEYRKGTADPQSLSAAIRQGDLMALRSITFQDYTVFPGDSPSARLLANLGHEEVVRMLNLLPSVEPDDFAYLRTASEKKTEWILARILASKLGTSRMNDLIHNPDLTVRFSVATVLGRLMVKNDDIIDALTKLTKDDSDRVREKASVALAQVEKFPRWRGLPR